MSLKDVVDEIKEAFLDEYKSTQVIFSSRPWAALKRDQRYFTMKLVPFSRSQTQEFFKKWFVDRVEIANEMTSDLNKHLHLYEVVSTPLIATILCVVRAHGGSLPESLVDVHDERLRLLLHDWDSAKGVKRYVFSEKDKYHFIKKLAYHLHEENLRGCSLAEIQSLARKVLGKVDTVEKAKCFVNELIKNNNILLKDAHWRMGILVTCSIKIPAICEAKDNANISLANYFDSGWWESVITIYAQITRDITKLLNDLKALGKLENNLERICELLELHPNTEYETKEQIYKLHEMNEAVEHSFVMYEDYEILRGLGKPKL